MEAILNKIMKKEKDITNEIFKNKLIFKKYRLYNRIGKGSFGFVYSGQNILDNTKVAVKFECKAAQYHLLEKEGMFLSILKGVGIPEVMSYGKYNNYYILVQELLGESLGLILKKMDLTVKDVAMIALQIIDRIEYIHSKNIIHRDIKPSNFLLGLENKSLIHIIDFGIARKYRSSRTGKHIRFSLTGKLFGTLKFISYNAARGVEQSRRDDIESISYMLPFLAGKILPWEGLKIHGYNAKRNYKTILSLKKKTNPDIFCEDLPEEFAEYIKYSRNLLFEQEPDYEYIRNLFRKVLSKNNSINDLNFSWNNKNNGKKSKINKLKEKNVNKDDNALNKSKNKYINLLRRKNSPQARLYKVIRNSLMNEASFDNIFSIKSLDENQRINKHKRGVKSDISNMLHSNNINNNLSKDGCSNDSIKVQYNINIADITDETKNQKLNNIKPSLYSNIYLNNNISINNNKNSGYITDINLLSLNMPNIFKTESSNITNNKLNKKIFNASVDLDKKYIFGYNNDKSNGDYNEKQHAKSEDIKLENKTKEVENFDKKRKDFCKIIYTNIINKFDLNKDFSKINSENKKHNNMYSDSYNKVLNKINYTNLIQKSYNNYTKEKNNLIPKVNYIKKKVEIKKNIIPKPDMNIIKNKLTNPQKLLKMKLVKRTKINNNYRNNTNIKRATTNTNQIKRMNEGIIIINNNINSFSTSYTPRKYKSIKDKLIYQQPKQKRNRYIISGGEIKPIMSFDSKIIRTDNNYNKQINNIIINRIAKNNNINGPTNYVSLINNSYNNTTFNGINNNSNKDFINFSKKRIINKSNDNIIKRYPKSTIRIHNYRSIIDRIQLNSSKRKEIERLNFETFNQNPSINRTKLKTIKLNDDIPISHQPIININNNNNEPLLRRLKKINNNNFANANTLLTKQYLSTDNNNIGRFIWSNHRNYGKINSDNLYDKLNGYNNYYDNNLFQSKSNANILERKLNNRKRKKYNYSGNNFDDYIRTHANSKFNYSNDIYSKNMNMNI